MIVYFARHGESLANTRHVVSNRDLPHPLTESGRDQARRLAERFSDTGLTAIYNSPVPRARETARIIAEALNITAQSAEGLREFDAGVLEGRSDPLTWLRFSMLWNNWFYRQKPQKRLRGGESFTEAADRFSTFTAKLAAQYGDTSSRVLCIAHGGILKVGLPGLLENVKLEQARDAAIVYTAVIKSEYCDGKWICLDWQGVIPAAVG
jgi:probable phosphoglycerate mutase